MRNSLFLNPLRHLKHGAVRTLSKYKQQYYEQKVVRFSGGSVLAGPFMGIALSNEHVFGSEIPKLLGTYELELYTPIQRLLSRKPKAVCNIGAAEGYYAIGFALHTGVKFVFAYEALEKGRALIVKNAKLNSVSERVITRGLCDEAELWKILQEQDIDLMIIDIEGGELDILSERNVRAMRKTALLIESHDFCRPDCLIKLRSKFEGSHQLSVVTSRDRVVDDFPQGISIPETRKLALMDEMRPTEMHWLVCEPKSI